MTVAPATDACRRWANEVYAAIGFVPTAPGQLQLVAWDEGRRVGLGRLVPAAPGVVELGGIWVDPGARGRGVALAVVERLVARAEGTVYCIPFAPLTALYRRCGFVDAGEDDAPDPIRAKLSWCRATYETPVVLLRLG